MLDSDKYKMFGSDGSEIDTMTPRAADWKIINISNLKSVAGTRICKLNSIAGTHIYKLNYEAGTRIYKLNSISETRI